MILKKPTYIYTDGSCCGNGSQENVGGFAVLALDKNEKILYNYYKKEYNTTNNRMEMKAILYSFLNYGVKESDSFTNNIPILYTDSNYCLQTFTNWMFNWARNGWIKSDKKVPENLDLIKAYYDWYQKGYRIDIRKVKGHNGNKWNELVDQLATGKITIEKVEELLKIQDKTD